MARYGNFLNLGIVVIINDAIGCLAASREQ